MTKAVHMSHSQCCADSLRQPSQIMCRHETNPAIIAMPSVSEIQLAILELSQDDYAAGRLDFLIGEAVESAQSVIPGLTGNPVSTFV